MAVRKINGFTPREASAIVGLTVHMLNYLARHGYLVPTYGGRGRGRVRHYSYRDLVVAKIVARLLGAGLEIRRLKDGIAKLSQHSALSSGDATAVLRTLVTDGSSLYMVDGGGGLNDVADGQLAFGFILDLGRMRDEVVDRLDSDQLRNFSLKNRKLRSAA